MIQLAPKFPILIKLIKKYVPLTKDSDHRIHLYLYDYTDNIDYYILNENLDESGTVFALVDPLEYDNVLEFDEVYFNNLEEHKIYCKVYSRGHCPKWQTIRNHLLPLKTGIPNSK